MISAAPVAKPSITDSGTKSKIRSALNATIASRDKPASAASVAMAVSSNCGCSAQGVRLVRMTRPVVLVGPTVTWALRPSMAATMPGTAAVTSPYIGGKPDNMA